MHKKGFTFVETLIVIGIIALLATAIVVVVNPTKRFEAARDAQREIHLQTMLATIERKMQAEGDWLICDPLPDEVERDDDGEPIEVDGELVPIFKTIGTQEGHYNLFEDCLIPKYMGDPLYDPIKGSPEDTNYQIWRNPQTKYITLRYYDPDRNKEIVAGVTKYRILSKPRDVNTERVTEIGHNTAVSGGSVIDDGGLFILEAGVIWSKEDYKDKLELDWVNNETVFKTINADGRAPFNFTSHLHSLLGGEEKYYVRAYARNEMGVGYGTSLSFRTLDWGPDVRTLLNESDIGSDIVKLRGRVESLGVEHKIVNEAYFCWDETNTPLDHCPKRANVVDWEVDEPFDFEIYLTSSEHNIAPETTYHFKACAYNPQEQVRRCGEVIGFTTLPASPPVVETLEEDIIVGPDWAEVWGNILSAGGSTITRRGFCYDYSYNNPCNLDPDVDTDWCVEETNGWGTGLFSNTIYGLETGEEYQVCAFAENVEGLSFAPKAKPFETEPAAPTVRTMEEDEYEVGNSWAKPGGVIEDTGGADITRHGVCWSRNPIPTYSEPWNQSSCKDLGSFTKQAPDSFNIDIDVDHTGLWADTTYRVRAYAYNNKGISWGNEKTFKTKSNIDDPELITIDPDKETKNSVESGGDIKNHGGSSIFETGVCWGKSEELTNPAEQLRPPQQGDVFCQPGSLINFGEFSIEVTRDIHPSTGYFIQAYALNGKGYGYGGAKFFETSAAGPPVITSTELLEYGRGIDGKYYVEVGAIVEYNGDDLSTIRGVCYSAQTTYPSYNHPQAICTDDGTRGEEGSFSITITNLDPGTTYYFLAFAHNQHPYGTVHGEPVVSYEIDTCKVYINDVPNYQGFEDGEDLFNQCTRSMSCSSRCKASGSPGYCNGSGACATGVDEYADEEGKVCVFGSWYWCSATWHHSSYIYCKKDDCSAPRWYRGCKKGEDAPSTNTNTMVSYSTNWNTTHNHFISESTTKYKEGSTCEEAEGPCGSCKWCQAGSCKNEFRFYYRGQAVTYFTVENEGQCWMDRNLGASRVAAAYNDSDSYGDLFQWGRLSDNHQDRSSSITSSASSQDNPQHPWFIARYDWRDPSNNALWQWLVEDNIYLNNPCPDGWRVPTEAEWQTEVNDWESGGVAGAMASPLKLPAAGWRDRDDGEIYHAGSRGFYWTADPSVYSAQSQRLRFYTTNTILGYSYRGYGFSVRCIKD